MHNDLVNGVEKNCPFPQKIVSIKVASEITGMPESCLRQKIKEGKYPYIKSGEKRPRVLVNLPLLWEAMEAEALDTQKERIKLNKQFEEDENKRRIQVLGSILEKKRA